MNRRLAALAAVGLLVVALAVSGCGAKKTEKALSENVWMVQQILTDNGHTGVLPGTVPIVYFRPDGSMIGNYTVNVFNGSYQTDARNLKIGPLVATQWTGSQEEMIQEKTVKDLLKSATRYHIKNNIMQLSDSGGTLLMSLIPAPEPRLLGATWACKSLVTRTGELTQTIGASPVSAEFTPEGKLGGFGGVNRYDTTYTVNADKMTIGPDIAATKVAGPEPLMAQEAAYFDALAKTRSYKIETYQLTLSDASGKPLAVFIPIRQK